MLNHVLNFIRKTYQDASKTKAVIAVSGGIDSAVALSLLVKAFEKVGDGDFSKNNIFPIFLPYGDQDMSDAKEIAQWNGIPAENWQEINIKSMVDQFAVALSIENLSPEKINKVRLGNVMARIRMTAVYDLAKKLNALVCGTENKSEKYLGYFTRFGDEASDLEPIVGLYKTQVRELAKELNLPEKFLDKEPTAGLWADQTDEQELGFNYSDADKVLIELFDQKKSPEELLQNGVEGVDSEVIKKVLKQVKAMEFKLKVPYEANF